MSYEIALPRTLRIGRGASTELAEVIASLGLSRPLVVTDRFLLESGTVPPIVDALTRHGLAPAVFADTVPDPTTDSLGPGVAMAVAHRADCVVGFGGGSPMDSAKAIALLTVQGGSMRRCKAPHDNRGPALPLIAVPTTAGSGSEATRFTVVTDSESQEKMLCPGAAFLPVAAIIDFELTMSMPPRLTADTGVDALTHAVEAYVSRRANPFSDSLALVAVDRIGRHLRRAYADGTDVAARENMMLGATQAGIAFSNASVALVHGMSRPLGAHFRVAHGLSNAMLFPAVTAYSVSGAVARYADCARALGAARDVDTDAVAAGKLVDALGQLNDDLEVPTPKSYGVDESDWYDMIPTMAVQALESGSPQNNPRVPDRGEIERLYAGIYR